MNAHALIALAEQNVNNNRAMASSAKSCLRDARMLLDADNLAGARERALKSLAYSLGVFSALYKRASADQGMTEAQTFTLCPGTDETLREIEDAAIETDQDWDAETTTWAFSDGSRLQLCGFNMEVL